MGRVWHRFRWASGARLAADTGSTYAQQLRRAESMLTRQGYSTAVLTGTGGGGAGAGARSRGVAGPAGATPGGGGSGPPGGVEGARYPHDPPGLFRGEPQVDDAFSTIMQWLHSRIAHTR